MTRQAIDAPDPGPRDDVALPGDLLRQTVPIEDYFAARRRAPGLCPHVALAVEAVRQRRAADRLASAIRAERDAARGDAGDLARRLEAADALAEERRGAALRISDVVDRQNDYIVTLQRRGRRLLIEARLRRADWFALGAAAGAVLTYLVRVVTGGW